MELAAIIHELQSLVKGKIDQIYQPSDEELLLQLHVPGKGKQLLKIIPGKWLCLTSKKETTLKPSNFSLQLRKYLDNAFIKSISQKDSERIVIIELERKEPYSLIIELFSKGNIVLINQKQEIIAVLTPQTWKDRTLRVGEKYLFPPASVNWKILTAIELHSILKKSEKRNSVTALATEIGVGGLYAEELCGWSSIDKNKLPKEITDGEIKSIIATIPKFLKLLEEPAGYLSEDEVTPFPLQTKESFKKFSSYNEAIDSLIPFFKASPYEKKIKALQHTLVQQEESIQNLDQHAVEEIRKGESIYEHYSFIQELLEQVKEIRRDNDWQAVAQELQKEKRIKKVDLKHKTVLVEF